MGVYRETLNKLGFEEENPYEKRDPFKIPEEKIIWNRDDLNNKKEDIITPLLEKAQDLYRISLLIWGFNGSGKTWLSRYITKEIKKEIGEEKVLVIPIRLTKESKPFKAIYSKFIACLETEKFFDKDLKEYCNSLESEIKEKIETALEGRSKSFVVESELKDELNFIIKNRELTNALFEIIKGDIEAKNRDTAYSWLKGESPSLPDLRNIGISYKLDTDYKMFEIMNALIRLSRDIFSYVILIIDELRNVEPRFGEQLSEYLREILDEHHMNFGLICTITYERLKEEIYDRNYTDAFIGRMNKEFDMETVDPQTSPKLLREHQKVYRKKDFGKDQLYPFSEEGIIKLVELLDPRYKVPRFILQHCGEFAYKFVQENMPETIDNTFVEKNKFIMARDLSEKGDKDIKQSNIEEFNDTS